MSTLAPDPTYMNPNTGWTVQSNSASSGGTGLSHMGVVAGELGYTASTVNGIQQAAAGPTASSAADRSGAGAGSIILETIVNRGNVPPSHPADAAEGVY